MPTNIPLDRLLSPEFKASDLTKPQLRSVLSEYSGLNHGDLPPSSVKKQVYLDMFEKYIIQRRGELLYKSKPSQQTTPRHKKVSFDTSGYTSDDNPFQTPTARTRRSTPAIKKRLESLPKDPDPIALSPPGQLRLLEIVPWVAKLVFFGILMIYTYVVVHAPICQGNEQLDLGKLARAPLNISSNDIGFCWECPPHAICAENKVRCAAGYRLVPRMFGLLYPTCKVDRKHRSILDSLTLAMERFLGEQLGSHLCMNNVAFNDSLDLDPSLACVYSRDQLYSIFVDTDGPWKNHESFDKYFEGVLDRFRNNTLYSVTVLGDQPVYVSTVPRLGVGCRIKICIREFVFDHFSKIVSVVLAGLTVWYIGYWFNERKELKIASAAVLDAVVEKLVEQEALNRASPHEFPSTLSCAQLKDALLSNVSENRRRRIWRQVTKGVHQNSNIRESVTTIKGEQHRVWEWIGASILSPKWK